MKLSKLLYNLKHNHIRLQDYIDETCKKIKKIDASIHSFLLEPGRYSRLMQEARLLEERFPDPNKRPPLFGALVGIKDNFHVNGFSTHAGSLLPPSLFAGEEAESVTRLRQAGALILGKTVTTEFAYFEPGPTVNPSNHNYTPGGSSSGSAAAIAAHLSPLTLGSQTNGSVNRPASFCGVVGYKPSLGRIPTRGLVYFSKSMDQIGFFTKSMDGVDIVASVLCNNWSVPEAGKHKSNIKLGVPAGPYLDQLPLESMIRFEKLIGKLIDARYSIKRVNIFENIKKINKLHHALVNAEMAKEHASWFDQYESLYRPKTKKVIQEGRRVDDRTLSKAYHSARKLRKMLIRIMEEHDIDLWICPSSLGPAPHGIKSTGDPVMNIPWSHAGMPVITLPVDRTENGLPIGLQCIGTYMNDEQVVYLCKQLESFFQQ